MRRIVNKPPLLFENQLYIWIVSGYFTVGTTQDSWQCYQQRVFQVLSKIIRSRILQNVQQSSNIHTCNFCRISGSAGSFFFFFLGQNCLFCLTVWVDPLNSNCSKCFYRSLLVAELRRTVVSGNFWRSRTPFQLIWLSYFQFIMVNTTVLLGALFFAAFFFSLEVFFFMHSSMLFFDILLTQNNIEDKIN